jgi:branched-chain amino acid transport system permease protein
MVGYGLRPKPTLRMLASVDILITSALISGICLGSMYGLIALGFHVTYVVSSTVNFSQGSSVMLGAVLETT